MHYRKPSASLHDIPPWADWVELVCLAHLDRAVQIDEMLDRYAEAKEADAEIAEEEANEDATDADSEVTDPSEVGDETAEHNDRDSARVRDWFKHLAMRERLLGEDYPFTLSDGGDELRLRPKLSRSHRLYVALLMMSNLGLFRDNQNVLTNSFELLCLPVFRQLLPQGAAVHHFGANPLKKGRYSAGNLWARLNRLSADLGTCMVITKDHFAPENSGDNGLDLVGWMPMPDEPAGGPVLEVGRPILFAQCACTEEWKAKQYEIDDRSWAKVMRFATGYAAAVFIPLCPRRADGSWFKVQSFSSALCMDRIRIMHFLRGRLGECAKLPVWAVVENCLAPKEAA